MTFSLYKPTGKTFGERLSYHDAIQRLCSGTILTLEAATAAIDRAKQCNSGFRGVPAIWVPIVTLGGVRIEVHGD